MKETPFLKIYFETLTRKDTSTSNQSMSNTIKKRDKENVRRKLNLCTSNRKKADKNRLMNSDPERSSSIIDNRDT